MMEDDPDAIRRQVQQAKRQEDLELTYQIDQLNLKFSTAADRARRVNKEKQEAARKHTEKFEAVKEHKAELEQQRKYSTLNVYV